MFKRLIVEALIVAAVSRKNVLVQFFMATDQLPQVPRRA